MTEVKRYKAFDGTEFEKESDCLMYENTHRYDGIKMWDVQGKPITKPCPWGYCYCYVETEEQSNRFDDGTMPVGLTIPSIYLCETDVEAIVKIAKEIGWLENEKHEESGSYRVLPYVSEPSVSEGEGCFFTRDEWK